MEIDLGNIAPATPGIAAGYLSDLGNAVGNFAGAMSGVARAFFDAQATQELIAGMDYTYQAIDQFDKTIAEDTTVDYKEYPKLWDTQKSKIIEEANKKFTLQQSKDRYAEWSMGQFNTQGDKVVTLTQQRAVAVAEAQVKVSLDNAVRAGNESAVTEYIKSAVKGGILTGAQGMSMAGDAIPKARYNNVLNQLNKWNDPQAAAAALLADTEGSAFNIDEEQRLQAAQHFQSIADQRKKLADSVSEEDGKKYWAEFSDKMAKNGFQSLTDMTMYAPLVDKSHRETVRQAIERYKTGLSDMQKFNEDSFRDHIISQVWDWAANAPADVAAPWTEESLANFAVASRTPDGGVSAPKLRQENIADIMKAVKEADVARDDPQASAMYSRLYGAMDNGKNPAMEVTIKEIDQTIQDAAKHQALLAKRAELQRDYEAGKSAATDGKLKATSETILLEAYRIANSSTMSEDAKNLWIDNHVGSGLSPEDGEKVRVWVKPYNDIPRRKRAMDSIGEAYRLSMANPNLSTQGKKDLALELYNAQNVMDKLFIDPKTTQADIDTAVENFLGTRATMDLRELVKQAWGAYVDKFATGEARPAYREATAYEYLRETNKLPAEKAAQFTQDVRPKAEALEKDTLNKAGIKATFTERMSSGDLVYSTKKLIKGTTGKLLMSDTGGQGTLYQVRYQIKGDSYVPTVYTQNPTTGIFDVIAWEWK